MNHSNIDPFWNHVVKACKFCEHRYTKDTSIWRVKQHLSGETGHGVAICTGQVPKDVQEAALQAVGRGNKRQKTIASSSSVDDNAISSGPQQENNEVDSLAGDAGRIKMAVLDTEQGVQEGTASSRAEAGNRMENMGGEMIPIDTSILAKELIANAHGTKGEASRVPNLVGQAIGTPWDEIHDLSMDDDVENGIGGLAQPGAGASSSRGFTRNTNEIKGDALPTTKLVGQEFEDNKMTIWSWLMNDEVSSIGIYGIGGVGKTALVTHIYNQLLKTPNPFYHVYWIIVSQGCSLNRLQNSIARCIGLPLFYEDELHRAGRLSKELQKRQKWVLILDDLWEFFELFKVGIPVQVKGCKVILTTRSEKVCQQMVNQNKIKVKPLSMEEAWTLFMEKLGCSTTLPPKVEQIAKSMARECAGLPLGITTMAASMRGVVGIRKWRNALGELEESKVRQDDMEPGVFGILRFSYTCLRDSSLQQCFLYCSLFPKDFEVDKNDLICYLIDEGVIKGMKSRQAEFDKGHAMLDKLLNVCLLERGGYSGDKYVRMRDLIRDMALQLQQENSPVLVKPCAQLKELPDAKEWTENLVRVSLMQNRIKEIPSSHSPRCPSLSTLLLSNNELQSIEDSFFKQLLGLKVLDLSGTDIVKLPNSVSDLASLTALLLKRCRNLLHVPSLENLRALKRLDLSNTALEEMPQGLKWLSELRYLRLSAFGETKFPSGILSNLSHLQVFVMEEEKCDKSGRTRYAAITVEGNEVECLRKLETLECHFERVSEFVEFIKSRAGTQSLNTYKICAGRFDGFFSPNCEDRFSRNRSVGLWDFSINDFEVKFPNDIEELVICKCNDARSLCDLPPLTYATGLERIHIEECKSMESLVSSSWFCSAPPPSPSNGIFYGLKQFYCYGCDNMKNLFPFVLLPNLVNLEEIVVEDCSKMEIIATADEEGVMGEASSSCYSNIEFNLPKLKKLVVQDLPELKSICSGKLICNFLERIEIWHCDKLRRMSVSIPLLDNGQPSSLREIFVCRRQWWYSVMEWEHKDVLLPFVEFGVGYSDSE